MTASQPLAQDLQIFGNQVMSISGPLFKPLLLLLDQGFRGVRQFAALREGFVHIPYIFLTNPYRRNRREYDIYRAERTAVERTIGHMAVHLRLEHPPHLGHDAAQAWVLGSIFLLQRIALYNHIYHPNSSPLSVTHLKYS